MRKQQLTQLNVVEEESYELDTDTTDQESWQIEMLASDITILVQALE